MLGTRKALVVLAAACAITLTAGNSASADDEGSEYAAWYSVGPAAPEGTICGPSDLDGNRACFRKNGDQWFIYDGSAGGWPSVDWENQLVDKDGIWHSYRSGECVNPWPYDNWGVCNKDYYESSTLNKLGGRGSQVRFRLCQDGGCTRWSAWIDNNG
ncbi:hypothetical protein [Streptomyces sp. NPDC102462]|uniref:hypothetical protein n=1 Tax=Streptomyces sp. NPDC102462 TaxID=3366178 RepID=UPI0037F86A4C